MPTGCPCARSTATASRCASCARPQRRPNMKTALLRVGSVLPSGQAIERRPIRGVPSEGMLCSEKELELSDDHHGIMDLPADAPTGASLHDYLGLNDWMVEVSVTPNRGDCLSVLGLAREIAALTGGKLRVPAIPESPPRPPANDTRIGGDRGTRCCAHATRPGSSTGSGRRRRRRGSASGSRPAASAPSTTSWTSPTTSCSKQASPCTPSTHGASPAGASWCAPRASRAR